MLGRFLKPKWQHKDPATRTAALATLTDEKILARLAAEDPDASVRIAAIQRIDAIDALLAIPAEGKVQAALNQRLGQCLKNNPNAARYSEALAKRLPALSDPQLINQLATASPDAKLRQAALALVDDEATLLHCCGHDASAEIRRLAAERLDNETAIRKALKQLGKKDKRAAQILRAKLDQQEQQREQEKQLAQQIEALEKLGRDVHWQRDQTRLRMLQNSSETLSATLTGPVRQQFDQALEAAAARIDAQRQNSEALQPAIEAKESQCDLIETFCQQLEQRHRISSNESREFNLTLDVFLADWNDLPILEEKLEASLSNRFHAGLARARKLVDNLQANARQSRNLESLIHKAENLLKQDHPDPKRLQKLTRDWEAQRLPNDPQLAEEYSQHFSRLRDSLENRIARQRQQTEATLEKIDHWLDQIEATLATDKLGDAENLRSRVIDAKKSLHHVPASRRQTIEDRLQAINPKIRELSGWRHWSTDRAREQLLEEAIALKDQQHSVEERLKAVKSLRQRWKDLGNIDPVSRQRLWKKFDAACTEAWQLCQAHFDKEAEQRNKNLEKRTAICEALERLATDIDWTQPDWRATDKTFQQLRNRWRNCGPVARKDWRKILDRFNAAFDAVDQHLQKEREANFRQRTRITEQLEALAAADAIENATAQAKTLQAQWNLTVTSKRSAENKLWKRFRQASDAIFNRSKQQRQTAQAETRALIEQREELCANLEDLTLDGAITPARLEQFREEWNDQPPLPEREVHRLEKRFLRATRSAEELFRKQQIEKQQRVIEQMLHRKQLLDQFLQDGDESALQSEWDSSPAIEDPALEKDLQSCRESLLSGRADDDAIRADQARRDGLLLDMEIILEIESPESVRSQRMERQVDRLANKLSSGEAGDAVGEVMGLLVRYCVTPYGEPEKMEQNRARIGGIGRALLARLERCGIGHADP